MPTAKQRANWARFAKMARARARARKARTTRRKAPSRSTRRKRVSPKRSYMARRRTTRKRSGSRRGKTIHVLSLVANANALFQGLEPFLQRGIIAQVQAGDFAGIVGTLREGGKEAVSLANLFQAVGPIVGLRIARKVAGMVGAPNPRMGKVALY